MTVLLITHPDGRFGGRVSVAFVSLSVILLLFTISQNDAARTTKPDIEMFPCESWKTIYSGGQKVKSQGDEAQKTVTAWVCALL